MTALLTNSANQRRQVKSDIRFLTPAEEPAYWLSLYNNGQLYSTTGQQSYREAYKFALLWISIKSQDRSYKIMHEVDGFQIEEDAHIISQKCKECAYVGRWSVKGATRKALSEERRAHRAKHECASADRLFKPVFWAALMVVALIMLCACKGWL